jgi:hypothetical protein
MRKKRRLHDKNGPPEQNYTKRKRITSHYNTKKEIRREHERIGTSYKLTKKQCWKKQMEKA